MESVEVVWIFFQDFYVASLSLGKVPGVMERTRPSEQVGDVVTLLNGRVCAKLELSIHPTVAF
jgi:hypothetical protein